MDHIIYDEPVYSPDEIDYECTLEEEADVTISPVVTIESNNVDADTIQPVLAALDKKRSSIWLEFLTLDKAESSDGKQRSICKHCQKSSFISNAHYGTQNMQRHLRKCSAYAKHLKNQGGNKGKVTFDQKVYRDLVAKAIIKHGYAFSWVEHDEGYLCLNAHYVDDKWKLISIVLNFSHIDSPHTGKTMYTAVLHCPCFKTGLERDDDVVLRTMAVEMKSKFDKYWFYSEKDNYSMLFAFVVILDPRCKLSVLKFCYEKIFGDVEATLRISDLQFKLEKFYKLYTQNGTSTTPNINTNMGNASSSKTSTSERSILDIYLEDPKLDRTAELDILAFWKENEHRYKELSHLARDILDVPLTTAASESTFSIGSRMLNKWKSSYIHENVEALITTRSWMFSYENDGFVGSYVD
uniref:BED-type domain-containing protein n=1 Tax=Chenopodium quinoa TaxID=63459 RepID=A0A803N5F9_CHEQI